MVSYKLVEHAQDCARFVGRLLKYNQRGFQLLIPIAFKDEILNEAIKEREKQNHSATHKIGEDCQDDGLSYYCSFMLNNDSCHVRQEFIKIIQQSIL